ncbi:Aldo/keto reductase [Pholiota conissans]|uniref:Aldo/keto reductase n=1 Tax=Pholiota conissans TaxID=109636 RepID=A0A9P6CSI4_9AGAR|nr:Aldo/keto reductase [Pholiota conissans]
MSIGGKWEDIGMGHMDKELSLKLLDSYYDNGGNLTDTANNYGEWTKKRGIRDRLFIAIKIYIEQKVMYVGNNAKSLHLSVEASLKKLRTYYIDLLYLHWWDWDTSIEEVMKALHMVVQQGKVLYLGVSDTPAWVVSKANQYARDHALTQFIIYQGAWNLMERSFEREIIPMAKSEGDLGWPLAPWNILASGKIRTDDEERRRRESGEKGCTIMEDRRERNDNQKLVCNGLEEVPNQIGAKSITSVAIVYLMQKTVNVFPIANIEALSISLTEEQIKSLKSVVGFDPGFPNTMIGDGTEPSIFLTNAAPIEKLPVTIPLRPTTKRAHN